MLGNLLLLGNRRSLATGVGQLKLLTLESHRGLDSVIITDSHVFLQAAIPYIVGHIFFFNFTIVHESLLLSNLGVK